MLQQIVETRARETAALASAIKPLPQSPRRLIEEFLQSIAVARHSVVVVVAPELQVQRSCHCGRHAQGLMHSREIIEHHIERECRCMVREFFAKSICQARESSNLHPD